MPRYDQRCLTCDWTGEVIVSPDAEVHCPSCGGQTEHVWTESPKVIDDTLPGGARWVENLGHEPVWVETKTQLQAELDKRDLRLKESPNRNRHDTSPWATQTTLTASAADDPHLQQVAAQVRAGVPSSSSADSSAPQIALPPGLKRLQAAEVALITQTDKIVRALGMQLILDCRVCRIEPSGQVRVVANNRRDSNGWRMYCGHRQWVFFPEVNE